MMLFGYLRILHKYSRQKSAKEVEYMLSFVTFYKDKEKKGKERICNSAYFRFCSSCSDISAHLMCFEKVK